MARFGALHGGQAFRPEPHQDAQRAQQRPAGVDELNLPVAGKGLGVGRQAGRVPPVVAGELACMPMDSEMLVSCNELRHVAAASTAAALDARAPLAACPTEAYP